MYTSLVLVALAGSAPAPSLMVRSPSWQSDYPTAYRLGHREQKPLAVVIGHGPAGWEALSRDGAFDGEVRKLLHSHYVCVYLDTSRAEGRRLAADFEMPQGPGLVLSNHAGDDQAFRHEGRLSNRDLEDKLRTYADPDRVVQRTESDQAEDGVRNYYAPAQEVIPAQIPAQVFAPNQSIAPPMMPFGGMGGFGGFGGFGGGFGGGGRGC